jgi:flagellar hook-associated protein 3 FlgL
MVISTSNIYQRNIDNFSRQSTEINNIQAQASTGKKDLSLAEDLTEIDNLNAAEDHKTQTMQFNSNAIVVSSHMNEIDNVFDQLHNVASRLLELTAQSGSAFVSDENRKLFGIEATAMKSELFQLANQVDSKGNSIFGGISGERAPFILDNQGLITYNGSGANKSLQVSHDSHLRQNFAGDDVFLNLGTDNNKFSVFDAVDNFVDSMQFPLGAEVSGNLFSDGNSMQLVFPEAGSTSKFKFDLITVGGSYSIDASVYGNDYTALATAINAHTAGSGVTASSDGTNKITLTHTTAIPIQNVRIENYSTDLDPNTFKNIGIRKTIGGATDDDYVVPHKLRNSELGAQFTQVLEQFNKHQQDLSVTAKTANNYIDSTQETIVALTEDISDIEDADMAELLTKLQQLLTSKEAAQATFTRVTSQNLFDFFG